jgi:hypothetical protein
MSNARASERDEETATRAAIAAITLKPTVPPDQFQLHIQHSHVPALLNALATSLFHSSTTSSRMTGGDGARWMERERQRWDLLSVQKSRYKKIKKFKMALFNL